MPHVKRVLNANAFGSTEAVLSFKGIFLLEKKGLETTGRVVSFASFAVAVNFRRQQCILVNAPLLPIVTKLLGVGMDSVFLGASISRVGVDFDLHSAVAIVLALDIDVSNAHDTGRDEIERIAVLSALVARVTELTHHVVVFLSIEREEESTRKLWRGKKGSW